MTKSTFFLKNNTEMNALLHPRHDKTQINYDQHFTLMEHQTNLTTCQDV